MKLKPSPYLEKFRLNKGAYASTASYGNNGAFSVRTKDGVDLFVIASDGGGWEHVSVSPVGKKRCPTWEEMCYVKSLFWSPDEVVIQYHPAESNYVNQYPYCLHLWRPMHAEIPMPPLVMV